MEMHRPSVSSALPQNTLPLKDSIRDMMQLQENYHLPDELFWEIFNTRVLMNQDIDVMSYADSLKRPSA